MAQDGLPEAAEGPLVATQDAAGLDFIDTLPNGNLTNLKELFTLTGSDEGSGDSDDSEGDDEPLIVQLMESMFNRKKTVYESQEMQPKITVEAIKKEIRDVLLKEKAKLADLERTKQFEKRMQECERLNQLIRADENPEGMGYLMGRATADQFHAA